MKKCIYFLSLLDNFSKQSKSLSEMVHQQFNIFTPPKIKPNEPPKVPATEEKKPPMESLPQPISTLESQAIKPTTYMDMYGRERVNYKGKELKKIEQIPPFIPPPRRKHFIIQMKPSSTEETLSSKEEYQTIHKKTTKRKTQSLPPSPSTSSTTPTEKTNCCPICFQPFPATMSIMRRQNHVNLCLEHQEQTQNYTKISDSSDDSIFEYDPSIEDSELCMTDDYMDNTSTVSEHCISFILL